MNIRQERPTILFAILYWGLGHATRSLPLIQHLLQEGYRIVICTDGPVVSFIEQELGQSNQLVFEFLPPYGISYQSDSMLWNMTKQLPRIYNAYRKEKRVFKKLVKKYNPVACFSDNRYGCVVDHTPCFFIGHQWNILGPKGTIMGLPSKINQRFIRRFSALLIPDSEKIRLSKKLNEHVTNIPFHFIGIQSRFTKAVKSQKAIFKIAAILSGPEPARTRFESQLVEILQKRHEEHSNEEYCLIRGTKSPFDSAIPSFVHIYSVANSSEILRVVNQSEWIIARSGYSSLMDFYSLGVSKVILVPTPGQTEQEYLAKNISLGGFYAIEQNQISTESLNSILGESQENQIVNEGTSQNIETNQFPKIWKSLRSTFAIPKA